MINYKEGQLRKYILKLVLQLVISVQMLIQIHRKDLLALTITVIIVGFHKEIRLLVIGPLHTTAKRLPGFQDHLRLREL